MRESGWGKGANSGRALCLCVRAGAFADHAVVDEERASPSFVPHLLTLPPPPTPIRPLAHHLPSPSQSSLRRLSRLAAPLESCYFLWLLSTQRPLFIIIPSAVSSSSLAPASPQSSSMALLTTVSILLSPSLAPATR